jgi:hypothetical protein
MTATTSRPSPRLARLAAGLLAAAAGALLAGCGAGGGDADADPARVAPQNTLVYLVGTLRPEGDQKQAVDAIARKVFRTPDPGKRIQGLLDREFADDPQTRGTTYAEDIEPWLGKRAGVAITGFQNSEALLAAIFATKDAEKAREAVEEEAETSTPRWVKRKFQGVDYWFDPADKFAVAVVGDYLTAGSEPSVQGVIGASENERGLDRAAGYRRLAAGATDRLGFGYVDVRALLRTAGRSGSLPPQAGSLQSLLGTAEPVTMSLDATPAQLSLEVTARRPQGQPAASDQPPSLVAALPGDSWLALGVRAVGQTLQRVLTQVSASVGEATFGALRDQFKAQTGLDVQRDVIAALGDLAVFARGTNLLSVGGGLVIRTPDQAAGRRLVARLRPLIDREAGPDVRVASTTLAGGASGFRVSTPELPGALNVVAKGDRLVVAYGDAATEAAFSSASPLSGSPEYRAAQSSLGGAPPLVFVSFAPIAQLIGASGRPEAQGARTYLEGLRTLAVGARTEGQTQRSRVVLTVK